jgi:hypothetical protein
MPTKVPLRYLPVRLTRKDKQKQARMLLKSRKLYKKHQYFTRKKVASFKSKPSPHVADAIRIYNLKQGNVKPSKELMKATGCSLAALEQIVRKGEGAYFSSGSRPNQSAQSWGLARLASSITQGKAAAVDYKIISEGCNHNKKAFKLAAKARQTYGYGNKHTKRVSI